MSDVALAIGSTIFGGWKSVDATRSIEQIAGTFSLSVSEKWPGQQALRSIQVGDSCTVAVDDEVVITGYVDDVNPGYSASNHTIEVAGRDATGDLVDCSAVQSPGEWQDRKLPAIVAAIAKPFGITVSAEVDTGAAFKRFRIEEAEAAFEAIERACRMRAVLPVSDGKGGLILTRAGTARADVQLKRGVNVLEANGQFTWRDRYSRYVVKSQRPGIDDEAEGAQTSQIRGEATDPDVTRYRPLVMIAEQAADIKSSQDRARWERSVRAARARRISATVQGWREHAGGRLWEPNRIVHFADDWLSIDHDLLITSVTYSKADDGSRTVLSMLPPGAFELRAKVDKREGEGWML